VTRKNCGISPQRIPGSAGELTRPNFEAVI